MRCAASIQRATSTGCAEPFTSSASSASVTCQCSGRASGARGAARRGRQAMDAEPAAATRGAGGRVGAGEDSIADASRAAPHVRHSVAPDRRRHLQVVEDPRTLQRCRHRDALRTLAEGGSRGRESAGQDSGRTERHRQRRANASTSRASERCVRCAALIRLHRP